MALVTLETETPILDDSAMIGPATPRTITGGIKFTIGASAERYVMISSSRIRRLENTSVRYWLFSCCFAWSTAVATPPVRWSDRCVAPARLGSNVSRTAATASSASGSPNWATSISTSDSLARPFFEAPRLMILTTLGTFLIAVSARADGGVVGAGERASVAGGDQRGSREVGRLERRCEVGGLDARLARGQERAVVVLLDLGERRRKLIASPVPTSQATTTA